jgi:Ca-activated chloride channel family protein
MTAPHHEGWHFTLLGYQAGMMYPWAVALTLIGLALAALGIAVAFTRRARLGKVLPERLAPLLAPGTSVARQVLNASFTGAGLFLFAWALAEPQCGSHSELTKRRGIDVVVALDASKSMLARDVAPSRLERAKLELNTLLDSLQGDRVGIVVFAGDAFIQCPLTSDYSAAKLFLKAVETEQMQEGGTNIGAALQKSKDVFEGAERGAKEKVVILISDGEDLSGEIDEGLDALKEAGVRVYAVGIGSETGEPIPLLDKKGEVVGYKKDTAGNTVLTRLDRAGLIRIAESMGGQFFYQPKSVAMGGVIEQIEKLQKTELESRLSVHYVERYQWLLAPGLLLILAAIAIRPSHRGRR